MKYLVPAVITITTLLTLTIVSYISPSVIPPAVSFAGNILFLLLTLFAVFFIHSLRVINRWMSMRKKYWREVARTAEDYAEALTALEEKNEYLLEKWSEAEKKRRTLIKDMRVAQRIQNDILPKRFPTAQGLGFACHYLPIEEIGGDFYDVIPIGDGKIAVLIADVSGHGIAAALITTMLKSAVHSSLNLATHPGKLAEKINKDIARNLQSIFYLTAVIGVIDVKALTFRFVNAAHPAPLLLRDKSVLEVAGKRSTIIGKFEHVTFRETQVILRKNDKLLFYTDGLVEASRDRYKREQFGIERVKRSLRKRGGIPIAECIEGLREDFSAFTTLRKPDDDLTLLGIAFYEQFHDIDDTRMEAPEGEGARVLSL